MSEREQWEEERGIYTKKKNMYLSPFSIAVTIQSK